MAVPEQTPYIEYSANGISKKFSVPFQCLSKNTLIVSINGAETLPQLWEFLDGDVVFITAPLNNSIVSIKRSTHLKREVSYNSFTNSMLPTVFNGDFDRVWHTLQEQSYKLGQYDFDYSYAVNTANQANQKSDQANQKADLVLDGLETVSTETQPILRGGTGAKTAEDARTNLDVYSQAEVDTLIATGGSSNIVGIENGGTGADTAEDARTNLGVMSKNEVNTAISEATPPATPDASETVAGKAEIATQTETNTATDDTRLVTPKKLLAGLKNHLNVSGNAPMFACRAWANFDGAGGVTINGEGNILSISRSSVGRFVINFKTPMPTNNYAVLGMAGKTAANSTNNVGVDDAVPPTTSSVAIIVGNSGGGSDSARISIGVFC